MMKRKIVSLFLAVVMVLSMVPTYTVFADEPVCDHIFTEETLPDEDNVFWETHSEADYYVGSKAFISAELPASCEKDGWQLAATESTGFCMICGGFITENDKIAVEHTGHNLVEDENEAVAPTCEDDGSKAYYCSNVNYDIKTEQNPETGLYTAYVVTEPCLHTETVAVPALNHDYSENVTEATCTAAGYTTYTCARCGYEYDGNAVDALGHDYQPVGTTDPTCINKGYTTYECTRCGDACVGDIVRCWGFR